MKKIERLNVVCGVLKTFIEEHGGALDEKGIGELRDTHERVGLFLLTAGKARNDVAGTRSRRNDSFKRLRKAITGCRKTLEMVGSVDGGNVVVPHVGKSLWRQNKIDALGTKYLEALETSGPNPAFDKPGATLKASLDEYRQVYCDATQKVFSTQKLKDEMNGELPELSFRLKALTTAIASRIPPENRNELYSRLRAALPRSKTHKDTGETANTTIETTQPVKVPVSTSVQTAA